MKVYVEATSKKALNERLEDGESITGINHSMFGDGGSYSLDADLPKDTIIAVWDKMSGGSPVAKSWGTWDGTTVK